MQQPANISAERRSEVKQTLNEGEKDEDSQQAAKRRRGGAIHRLFSNSATPAKYSSAL